MTKEIIEKAQELFTQGQEEQAITLLEPLVSSGNIIAKSNLGLFLAHLYKNNEFPRLREGGKLLQEACEAGEASACHNLASLWLGHSPSIGKDIKKAAKLYLKAKELGGPVANEEFYQHMENILHG